MYLKSLKLHNFRVFEDLKIDFHENLTVIIGSNGAGKTTIMEGIAIALSSMFVKVDVLSSLRIDRAQAHLKSYEIGSTKDVQEQYPVLVGASATVSTLSGNKDIEWARGLNSPTGQTVYGEASQITSLGVEYQKALRDGDTQICLPIMVYYGTGRLWDYHRNKQTDVFEKSNRLNGYIDCFDGTANVKLMMNWFMKMTVQKYANQELGLGPIPELEAVYSAMKACYSRITGYNNVKMQYSMATKELEVAYTDGDNNAMRISINQLSDGYKSMISLVADIAYRMAVLNPQFLGDVCQNTDGVVFIDEIDLHLHPAWQQRVLDDLRAIFPKVQFIVTTHAPAVINTVPKECIRILKNNAVKNAPIETYGKDANSVLTAIMEADERPAPVKVKFDKFYDALASDDYDTARKVLNELKDELGDNYPDITSCEVKLDLAEM
ncbi:MAG TPA: AAA family ATPase [Ruminococcus flavefaciens]|nr:AAA family ATPase [Ruminococcus flavefaciens]